MSDDEMASAISDNFPQYAPKAAASTAAAPKPAAPAQSPVAPDAPAATGSDGGLLDAVSGWYGRTKQAILDMPVLAPGQEPGQPAPMEQEALQARDKAGVMSGKDGEKGGVDLSDLPVTPEFLRTMQSQWNAATPQQRIALAERKDHMGVVARRLNAAYPDKVATPAPDTLGLQSNDPAAILQRTNDEYQSTAASDMLDPTAEARARQLVRGGVRGDMVNDEARVAALHDTPLGTEPGLTSKAEQTDFDFAAYKRFNQDPFWSNPVIRGAVKGYEGYKQGILGMNQAIGETLGMDVSGQAALAKASRDNTDVMGESANYLQRNFEGTISSIAQQLPALIGGAASGSEGAVLGAMFAQTFGQEYSDGRAKGQTQPQALTRASLFGAFEVIGEKFGLGERLELLRHSAQGVETNVLAKWMANTLREELPGELLTTTGEFGVDKLGGGVGMNTTAGLADYLQQMGDTVTQTIMQGGLMSAGTSGLNHARAYTKGAFDRGEEFDANGAQRDALHAWNTSGLSPSSRTDLAGQRQAPTWADATNPGAGAPPAGPAGRVEPTIGDITGAGSVDDAIAAANAVVNSTSPHATAADIDALEEQAGLMAAANPAPAPTQSAQQLAEQLRAEHDVADQAALKAEAEATHGELSRQLDAALAAGDVKKASQLLEQMQQTLAQRANVMRDGKAAAETPPADLPAGPEAAPAADLTGKESADPSDWNPFPAEMRSLGVPRAQMPQIRAEHRGAMVNFLNARGITHDHVEVPAESLRPTQREFSVSKVDKALEYEGGNRSILISSDNYVLDGHHQWMAAALNGQPVPAIRLNAPIKQLVKSVHEFPSSTVDTSSASAAPAPAEPGRPLSAYEQGQERIRKQEEAVQQAIEKQAAHRAGQAPQEPGSSIPTAAERAPLPAPKPTAGQRMRERIRRDNPFLAFLATHGLHIDERSDTGGQKGKAGNVIVPGFGGSLYRKKGARLDELAQLAHEAGFLSDDDINNPADTGGTRKLADMIERAVHSKEVIEQPGLIEAHAPSSDQRLIEEAQSLGLETEGKTGDQLYDEVRAAHAGEEAKRETSGAETHDEQDAVDHYESQVTPQELADADIPFDLNDPRLAPTNNLTDEQIDALFGIQKATGPQADRGQTQGHAAEAAREGAAPAGEQGEAGQDLLTSYTPGEVVAREDAAAAHAKAVQAERDKLDALRKKAQDEKEGRARADATVDDFQLGQDAHAQLSGQRGMFDEPAPAAAKPAPAMPKHQYDPERARPLLLIPCSDAKLEGTHKAIDLYKGVLYDVYRKWKPTENRPDVYILSAKHGIIHADTLLENYEQPMNAARLAELMAKPFDPAPFAGKNFNEVYIAGSEQYRQLGQRYVDELRKAGNIGPDAPVGHPPKGSGIGTQRGDLADYLRKVDSRGPVNASELSDQLDAEHAARQPAPGERLANGTAPEHVAQGVDNRELGQIVGEFNDAQAEMMQDGHPVSNIFAPPKKKEVVRLADKARATGKLWNEDESKQYRDWLTEAKSLTKKGQEVPAELADKIKAFEKKYLPFAAKLKAEAKATVEKWKEHARAQGKDPAKRSANSQKVVLSFFDLSGEWSKPWEEAGYQVYRFDIQADPVVGDVNNFSTEFFNDWFSDFEGMDIHAILAATPCTDFASSGNRHFAAKDADGRTVASVKLVHQTLKAIEYFKPAVWALENPVGRIEKLGGLPPWRLSFDPYQLGDDYTKKTLIWGRFNADLPVAPAEPTEGSKMWSQYGGKSMATKNARSETPEGFSYGFFLANNAIDHPGMTLHGKFDRLDRGLIDKALAAGIKPDDIESAVEDHYYMDLDDHAANDAIRELIAEKGADATAEEDGQIPLGFYSSVTVPYRALGAAKAVDTKADKALSSTREEIQQLEDMLKCMGG